MPRISGVDIPANKPIWISLTYLYGVGRTNSQIILKELGIDPQRRAKDLSEDELAKIIGVLDRGWLVEGALRRHDSAEHRSSARDQQLSRQSPSSRLPVRGQRTRSNARTRKGPRKTVAGKKGVKELGK